MITINSIADFSTLVLENRGVLFYFSTASCSVGEALEPKVRRLLSEKFPRLNFCFIDMNASPEISARHQVFVEPTILLFLDGKESMRKSRHIGLIELEQALSRIYSLAFE